ncbi:hypothetical protein BS78_06G218700 [Paspalum vaginatum]|nr:hypothetical protein BS78_06G218700 [Paspalum vaginatum]
MRLPVLLSLRSSSGDGQASGFSNGAATLGEYLVSQRGDGCLFPILVTRQRPLAVWQCVQRFKRTPRCLASNSREARRGRSSRPTPEPMKKVHFLEISIMARQASYWRAATVSIGDGGDR